MTTQDHQKGDQNHLGISIQIIGITVLTIGGQATHLFSVISPFTLLSLSYLTLVLNVENVGILLELHAPPADKRGQIAELEGRPVPTSASTLHILHQ